MDYLNPDFEELGIIVLSESEREEGGLKIKRFVVKESLTPEQTEELESYGNVRISKNGAARANNPELTYDVIYIAEAEEVEATEDFSNLDESFEISTELDKEIGNSQVPDSFKYTMLAQAINLENDSIIFYNQLLEAFPEHKAVLEDIKVEELKHIGQLQALMNLDPTVNDNVAEGLKEAADQEAGIEEVATEMISTGDEDPRLLELENLVIDKLKADSAFSEEDKDELIDEIGIEGVEEFMGLVEIVDGDWVPSSNREAVLGSRQGMEKAANDYIESLKNLYNKGQEE